MKLFAFLTLSVISMAPLAATQYFGFDVGTNHCELTSESNRHLKVGYKAGAKYGYIFGNGFRAEAEVTYRHNPFQTKYNIGANDDVTSKEYNHKHSWAYLINGYFDMDMLRISSVVPYVGVGMGYCQNSDHNKVKFADKTSSDKLKDNRFAYQGVAGLKFQINDQYASSIQYNYFCGRAHAKEHSVGMALTRNF